jgi:hypothetical protein
MEELLRQFSEHLRKKISNKLAENVENYLANTFSKNHNEHDITEHEIKNIVSNFFQTASEENTVLISESLYNNYIEEDDKSLICALKLFLRTYEYFYKEKLKRLFFRWRFKLISSSRVNPTSPSSEINISNYPMPYKKQKLDVFQKLYSDAKSKQDEKLLGEEMKRFSEMNECTFRPNIKSIK